MLGATIGRDGQWHRVISDPRKNMLLDVKNISQEDEAKVLTLKLEGSAQFEVENVTKKATILGVKEYTDYSEAEEQFLLPSGNDTLNVKNASCIVDQKKSVFAMNDSWKESLDYLVKSIGTQTKILVNGVVNSGKSTFASCLINQILTKTKKEVFFMDLDPGQPNYNLAGQLTLLKVNSLILTNSDFKECEIMKAYYLNTPTPNLNMRYYNTCVERLYQHFKDLKVDGEKVLIVNTCGWVEGLGAEIQLKVVSIIDP